MRRREDGERHTSKSTGRSKRVESSCAGDGGPVVLKKTEGQVYEYLCHTSTHVRNGNLGSDRTTTQAASVRKNCVRKIARVTRADTRRMVELREETGV